MNLRATWVGSVSETGWGFCAVRTRGSSCLSVGHEHSNWEGAQGESDRGERMHCRPDPGGQTEPQTMRTPGLGRNTADCHLWMHCSCASVAGGRCHYIIDVIYSIILCFVHVSESD